jgi:carbamoyl-phosphate synthase large subunit
MALELNVKGLMNVQFALKGDDIFILEVNPRASRTSPFVSKATGRPLAKIAASIMGGRSLKQQGILEEIKISHVAVKESVFPFVKFPGVDTLLGPEMKSTGEVMGIDKNFAIAFAKAQMGAGVVLPKSGRVFVSVKETDKPVILPACQKLVGLGFEIVATTGTARYLSENGVAVKTVNKVAQGRPHIVDHIIDGDIAMIFNTTEGWQSLKDSESIRRSALTERVPSYTTATASVAVAEAIEALCNERLEVRPLQDYY